MIKEWPRNFKIAFYNNKELIGILFQAFCFFLTKEPSKNSKDVTCFLTFLNLSVLKQFTQTDIGNILWEAVCFQFLHKSSQLNIVKSNLNTLIAVVPNVSPSGFGSIFEAESYREKTIPFGNNEVLVKVENMYV